MESMRHSVFLRGAERRAIVVIGAAIPFAVPAFALERRLQSASRAAARFPRACVRRARRRSWQTPTEPCAETSRATRFRLCPPRPRDSCRRSNRPCPSAASRARRPARLRSSARAQCSNSVARVSETRGSKYDSFCPSASSSPSRNGTISSSTVVSPVASMKLDHGVGQPQQIVGHSRAHAAARGRMPPVLHVAFDKLARRPRAASCSRVNSRFATLSAITSCSWSRNPYAPLN